MALLVKEFMGGEFKSVAERYRSIREVVRDVKLKTALGKGYKTDKRPVAEYAKKRRFARFDDIYTDEAIIGETGNILTTETMEMGMLARRMVVQIEKLSGKNATGFFIGENLLMTNAHVIEEEQDAVGPRVICGNQTTFFDPNPIYFDHLRFDPDRFFWKDDDLDVAVIAVHDPGNGPVQNDMIISDFGYMPLIKAQGKAVHGDPLNMFHYPGSQRQRVTLHNGNLAYLDDDAELDPYFWHTCDTQRGSSGAPVLNRHWQVVGIHSKGVPDTNVNGELLDRDGKPIAYDRLRNDPTLINWVANQGTRASRIVTALERAQLRTPEMALVRNALLALWAQPESWMDGLRHTAAKSHVLMRS